MCVCLRRLSCTWWTKMRISDLEMHWVSHNMHEKLYYCAVIILKNLQPGKTLLAHYWFALIGVSVFWKNIFMLFLSGCVLSEGHHYSHSYSSPPHLPLLWQPHLVCGPQGELDPQVPLLWYQGPFQEGRHSVCDMLTDVLITNFPRSSEMKSHVQNAN